MPAKYEPVRTVENALDIDGEHTVPAFAFGEVIVWPTPRHTRVIDKDVQDLFAVLISSNQGVAAGTRLEETEGKTRRRTN